MNTKIAETALKKVAERNGVSLESVLESIQEAIQQSKLGKCEKIITPEEAVSFLANIVLEVK